MSALDWTEELYCPECETEDVFKISLREIPHHDTHRRIWGVLSKPCPNCGEISQFSADTEEDYPVIYHWEEEEGGAQ